MSEDDNQTGTQLVHYEAARRELQMASTVDEVKEIHDRLEAMRLYHKQRKDLSLEQQAAEIRIRATRRLGELIIEAKAAGAIHTGRPVPEPEPNGPSPGPLEEPASSEGEKQERVLLRKIGITKNDSAEAQKLAKMPDEEFETSVDRWRDHAKREGGRVTKRLTFNYDVAEERNARERATALKTEALPQRLFGLIYADPDWQFRAYNDATGSSRAAGRHYSVSPLTEIQSLPVADIAAPDCVLFMWATVPMLVEAFCVADAWGFTVLLRDEETNFLVPDKAEARYVSQLIWLKQKLITGYWARGKHEILLIFTKGKPVAPAPGTQLHSAITEEVVGTYHSKQGDHSHKPDAFREMIDRLWPSTNKVELFARGEEPAGWTFWGDEAFHSNQGDTNANSGEASE